MNFGAVPLASSQLWHQKLRLIAAIAGITFAVNLIFTQLGFPMVVGKDDNTVYFRKVKVLRRSSEEVLVKAGRDGAHGIETGEWLSITELADVIDGQTKVMPEEIMNSDQSLTGEPRPKP